MLLRRSVKGTIGHVAASALLGGDSNQDPYRYLANLIHDRKNNNSKNKVDDFTNLGDGLLFF